MTDAEREGLRLYVGATPYSALVIHTKVEISPLSGQFTLKKGPHITVTDERHTYHAKVLETFRGKPHINIRYEMVVESWEEAGISSKPQIVTLCMGPRGLYWSGPGGRFDGVPDAIAAARRVAKQLTSSKPASFSDCN
ncbi:MAG: hypothetical protein HEQ39_06865 [Rhizobacter sp.]